MREVAIVAAKRTAIGSFQGSLASLKAPELGSKAIAAAVQAASIDGELVDQVYMGNVLTAGVGQAPARQATIGARLPEKVMATTVNKVCGSGLMAVQLARQAIQLEHASVVVAGGMESMSNAPYLLPDARDGLRLGHGKVIDSMIHDGLWDVYNNFHMGVAAELCAKEKQLSREDQDNYAKQSYERALQSIEKGCFKDEIVAVEVKQRKFTLTVDTDEEPGRFVAEKLSTLRPAFDEKGTVTAINASSINDGAAALLLMDVDSATKQGCEILAVIKGFAGAALKPEWFTVAPINAVEALMEKTKLTLADIDLFEINEAFSVVALACSKGLGLPQEKVNVFGGAVALGHPIGASGARILVTLISALKQKQKKRGVAAICLGGGEAVAMLVERP